MRRSMDRENLVASFYSSAAAGDKGAALKLIGIYNDHIELVARSLQSSFRTRIEMEDLVQEGVLGLLIAVKTDSLRPKSYSCSRWIKEKIHDAIFALIHAETKVPDSGWAPREL